ncbi:MAG: ABC transporter ATP-binding protein [Anaeroplasma bactoclasticum]|nr:ABC transporter ATP-binding protein [Anaeroplasma bactoclasticum]
MLELRNVSKSFKNKKILNDINLIFADYGLIGITGESGSGKTTLINIISGIESPDSGYVVVDGKNVVSYETDRLHSLLKSVAYMSQRQILLNEKTVYENLKEILDLYHVEDENQINIVLKKVRLDEKYKNRMVSTLSTGEAQRVCIAISLLKQSRIMVLDEATENLDKKNREFIWNILKEISKEKLVILVTHDIDSVQKFADRWIELSNREIYSDISLDNFTYEVQEEPIAEEVCVKKRKRFSFSIMSYVFYFLVPLIIIFFIAILSILIKPKVYEDFNYPIEYYVISAEDKYEFNKEEFEKIYLDENSYFIFNEISIFSSSIRGAIDYDFNYHLSKKIEKYNEYIISDTFLSLNPDFKEKYNVIETIHLQKPVVILNYDLVLENYLPNQSKNIDQVYQLYKEGMFLKGKVYSINALKTLSLDVPFENNYQQMEQMMRNSYSTKIKFGISICTIMLVLILSMYVVLSKKNAYIYYNTIGFYRICGQTNLEIRKKMKTTLYSIPIISILLICIILHLMMYLIISNIEYDTFLFRFSSSTYLLSLGISICFLIILNELKNCIIFNIKLKKLIKLR